MFSGRRQGRRALPELGENACPCSGHRPRGRPGKEGAHSLVKKNGGCSPRKGKSRRRPRLHSRRKRGGARVTLEKRRDCSCDRKEAASRPTRLGVRALSTCRKKEVCFGLRGEQL